MGGKRAWLWVLGVWCSSVTSLSLADHSVPYLRVLLLSSTCGDLKRQGVLVSVVEEIMVFAGVQRAYIVERWLWVSECQDTGIQGSNHSSVYGL